jgi:8-oxo-dGTP pyrophosphatase MutT (NUDIX family)
VPMPGDVNASGVVVVASDGRVYVRKVAGGFGGYVWSFAKGRVKPGLSLEQSALEELREEMGLEARIVEVVGDYEGDVTTTRFYLGELVGGNASGFERDETDEVRLVTHKEARKLLNRRRDRDVLDDAYLQLRSRQAVIPLVALCALDSAAQLLTIVSGSPRCGS